MFKSPPFSQSRISKMHQLWGSSFFPSCSKFSADFTIVAKSLEKSFCFLGNCISIGCVKFSLLRREYLSWTVNVLINKPKLSDIPKRDNFRLNFSHSDETVWWKCCRADFSSVWDSLTCWLSQGVLKRGFLDSNFRNVTNRDTFELNFSIS